MSLAPPLLREPQQQNLGRDADGHIFSQRENREMRNEKGFTLIELLIVVA
ncbi:MAG: prepilin-type N-terminal cleavage/methylation domain-containing protein, partial [Vicinamibacterales bacterium]